MLHPSRITSSLTLLALTALAPACGQQGGPAKGYPKPGEMRVLSMERQEAKSDDTNLIRNGDFRQWWAGAPVPNGFSQPDETRSKVLSIDVADAKAFAQIWQKPERELELESMLRTETAPLEAGRAYTLEVTAAAAPGRLVTLDLWARTEQGWIPVDEGFLTLMPQTAGLKTYQKTFTARSSGSLIVAARSTGAVGEDPVGWFEWRLTASGSPAT